MATLEERVSYLEGKVNEHSRGFTDLRELVGRLDNKIDRLDEKVSRHFLWLAGFQLTTLLAIIGLLSR